MNEADSLVEFLTVPKAPVVEMTDRELLEEIADSQRKVIAVVGGMLAAASKNPMLAMMLGGK